MQNIRAASVQFNHAPGDKTANMRKIHSFVEDAAEQQVELLVLPEMCITGYWHVRRLPRESVEALAEPVPQGASTERLTSLARRHGLLVGAGLIIAGAVLLNLYS